MTVFSALADQGVEVVEANFDDPASLLSAFEGVYGVFGHTNCEPYSTLSAWHID